MQVLGEANIRVNRGFIKTIGGATMLRFGIPATTAHNAVLALGRSARIAFRAEEPCYLHQRIELRIAP